MTTHPSIRITYWDMREESDSVWYSEWRDAFADLVMFYDQLGDQVGSVAIEHFGETSCRYRMFVAPGCNFSEVIDSAEQLEKGFMRHGSVSIWRP